jgi:protein ImuB
MKRVLSVYLPSWPIDLLKRRRGSVDGVLLVVTQAGRQVVARCSERAQKAGVEPGMTVAHARALLPSGPVLIAPHRPARDARALIALSHWAVRFTPRVTADPWPGMEGLCLDITGCLRLFHGEQNLMNLIASSLAALGLQARLACAPTLGCACALARFGLSCPCIVEPQDLRKALRNLPVCALRIDPATVACLAEVGVERVGQLLQLPRAQLSQRFGSSLLQAIDHATGHLPQSIDPLIPPEPILAQRLFAGPSTQLQALSDATRQLVDSLTHTLHHQQLGALKLDLTLTRADLPEARIPLQLTHPSRDAKHLWTLIRPKLESLHMGHGIESISLTASRTAPLGHAQTAAWGLSCQPQTSAKERQTRLDQPLSQLLDHLADRLGHQRLLTAEPRPSHLPEHSFMHRSVTESAAVGSESSFNPTSKRRRIIKEYRTSKNSYKNSLVHSHDHVSEYAPKTHADPGPDPNSDPAPEPDGPDAGLPDEPSFLLPSPEPVGLSAALVDAISPDEPVSLSWRGQSLTLVASRGPRRVTEPWWADSPVTRSSTPQASPTSRDYFRAQTHDGRWLWLYHEPALDRWFLQGWWA